MLLPHFAYPAQAPSITPIATIIALVARNKGDLANKTRRDEDDVDEVNGDESAGGKDNSG
jgi:hypothetical protein